MLNLNVDYIDDFVFEVIFDWWCVYEMRGGVVVIVEMLLVKLYYVYV